MQDAAVPKRLIAVLIGAALLLATSKNFIRSDKH